MFRQLFFQLHSKRFKSTMKVICVNKPLKEKFLRSLKNIKDCNRALEFSRLLFDAKTAIREFEDVHKARNLPIPLSLKKGELDTHLIIYKLQDIIQKGRPECFLADTISEAVTRWDKRHEELNRLLSLLLNVETYKFSNHKQNNSKEYLKHFIDDIECFTRLNMRDYGCCNYIYQTKGTLKLLEYELFYNVDCVIWSLSFNMKKAIDTKYSFSEEKRRELQILITDLASQILILLSHLNRASKSLVLPRTSLASNENEDHLEEFFIKFRRQCYSILDKVPLYQMTLKEKLLNYLKNSKSCNNAFKFCEILSEIKKPEMDSINADLAIHQLKEIMNAEKPEYNLINMILLELPNRSVRLHELLLLLLVDLDEFDFLKPKYQNSKVYLLKLKEEFHYLINLFNPNLYSPYMNLYNSNYNNRILGLLNTHLRYSTRNNTEYILNSLLAMYLSQSPFSEEEKRKFYAPMVEAIARISQLISRDSNYGGLRKIRSSVLNHRSSLQFFKDFFSTFPTNQNETQLKNSNMDEIDACIQNLDERITKMCDLSANEHGDLGEDDNSSECEDDSEPEKDGDSKGDSDFDDSDLDDCDFDENLYPEEVDSDLEEAGASKMPNSHTWWAKCADIINEKTLKSSLS